MVIIRCAICSRAVTSSWQLRTILSRLYRLREHYRGFFLFSIFREHYEENTPGEFYLTRTLAGFLFPSHAGGSLKILGSRRPRRPCARSALSFTSRGGCSVKLFNIIQYYSIVSLGAGSSPLASCSDLPSPPSQRRATTFPDTGFS